MAPDDTAVGDPATFAGSSPFVVTSQGTHFRVDILIAASGDKAVGDVMVFVLDVTFSLSLF